MLSKSFKSSKCKTSLKLATSRIKWMKNKKGLQMVQMKRELAQLLDSGQERTARIRVEHLIREEKMAAAYELIEIYCELIAARLPIIESQKNCPIDLKEAIASVIFASPRCSDIPELTDVKKHFTAKYGKEFITAALELRPNSGVARMVVEKLSAVAPDVQTKSKVLNAIEEEHNIKWDSKSFEEKESKPAEDLLNGPSSFEKADNRLPSTLPRYDQGYCNKIYKESLKYRTIPEKQDRRMLRRTFPAILSPTSILTVIIFSFLFQIGQSNVNSQEVTCSTTCVAQNCNTIGIRYGKYCGVGWSGCPGEKPCDDLDACCKVHDDCVGQKGMNNVKCHEKFKRCIKKVQKSGKPGFSTVCPVDVVVPTMDQGMDMAIMFSQFGNSKLEL
ncbi:hypothetical protein POM88_048114 [Heracleum sosnowskyi]|uniref:phospholipase A2 n=1 Tax=Heracleum sosnowskyi TaxID=360622 RepID=A0AAD8M0A0_9APIA|nr:hypothetical protein POM88_048114 [Heracleum sosnowskyi]